MAEGATAKTRSEWLGLGQMGWGIYALIVLANLYVMVSVADSPAEIAGYSLFVVVFGYVIVRFWKFVLGVVARILGD